MLARTQLRTLALAALKKRLVGVHIECPGVFEDETSAFPEVKLRCGTDRKTSNSKAQPNFTSTITLELLGRVQARTAEDCQDALDVLGHRMESAVLGDAEFVQLCQQIADVSTQSTISADGEVFVGGLHMSIACEVFEVYSAPEEFPDDYPGIETLTVNTVAQPYSAAAAPPAGGLTPQIELDALASSAAAAEALLAFEAPPPVVVTGASVDATNRGYYILSSTTDATSVYLSATPAAGDTVTLDIDTDLPPVVHCGGNPLLGVVEDLTLDRRVCITLRWIPSIGWRLA